MKSNNMFREQVNTVSSWFKAWSECEQTVALYSLLKRLSPTQVKFIAQVLEQGATENSQVQLLEEEANSAEYISKLGTDTQEKAVTELLSHLPLLRTGNAEAKTAYLKLIPQVLSYSIDNGVHIEESRQLLSFSLIHPAITFEERSQFTMWLGYLEERFTYSIYHQNQQNNFQSQTNRTCSESLHQAAPTHINVLNNKWNEKTAPLETITTLTVDSGSTERLIPIIANYAHPGSNPSNSSDTSNIDRTKQSHGKVSGHIPLQATSSAPPNTVSLQGSQSDNSLSWLGLDTCKSLQNLSPDLKEGVKLHSPVRRTTSGTPPTNISEWLASSEDPCCRVRPISGASDHAPLSPQSSVTSSGSGSDTHQDEGGQPVRNSFSEEGSGMQDVPTWLKSLRLHKYSYLFQQLSYKDMMGLSEPWLEAQNVTKGARHKIVLSIKKLKERQSLLRSLEKDIMSGTPIKAALTELKNILNTPMKAFSPSDVIKDKLILRKTDLLPPSPTDVEATTIPEGDLPGQFTRVMGKVCTQLLVCNNSDEECHNMYLQLIDKCINHEAFTAKQRKLLTSWKQQVQRTCHPSQHKYNLDTKPKNNWVNTFPQTTNNFSVRSGASRVNRKPQKTAAGLSQWCFGSRRSSIVSGSSCGGHIPLNRKSSFGTNMITQSCHLEQSSKPILTQTQSMPLRTSQIGLVSPTLSRPGSEMNTDTEITAQLDSLCLSMTEIALGSMNETSISRRQWSELQQPNSRVPASPTTPPSPSNQLD